MADRDEPFGDVAAALSARLEPAVGANAVIVYAAEPDGSLQLVGSAGVPDAVVEAWRRVSAQLTIAATVAIRTARSLWLPDLDEARQRYVLIGDPDVAWPSRAMLPVRDPAGGQVVAVVAVFCDKVQPFEPPTRNAVRAATAAVAGEIAERLRSHPHQAAWIADAQAVLDHLTEPVAVNVPVRDGHGEIVDYVIVAASPQAADASGRRGRDLIGTSTVESYPTIVGSELWHAYAQALRTGRPLEIGPFTYTGEAEGVDAEAAYSVRVSRFGGGVLITWTRHDEERRFAERLAETERLGKLGWGEWDMTTDRTYWSDGLYKVFDRDPEHGPATVEEALALIHPEDAPRIRAFLDAGEPADFTYRMVLPGGVRHVRGRFEATHDRSGRVLKVYGLVVDVTDAVEAARGKARLADVEATLAERQRSLQVEHRLVAALQQIILPLPTGVLELPGLRVAVRYQPAEQASRVGGDWYDVVALPGDRTLLVVGDVAGHGITAAATMARLRHALAALAVTTTEPGELLALLNRMVCDDEAEPTATVVVARFDPRRREVTWAQAGHPPPVVVSAHGANAALARPSGMIVGARRDSGYETATAVLAPGDTMLLYTDGLIERRDHDDDWLGPLLRTLDGARDLPLDVVLDRLQPANPDDDTCVLALRPRTA